MFSATVKKPGIYLLVAMGLFFHSESFAQQSIFRVRTNPLSVFNFLQGPNVNASFEHRLGKSYWTVNYTFGYHLPTHFARYEEMRGGFGKLEFRVYEETMREIFMGFELSGGYRTFHRFDRNGCMDCPYVSYSSERSWMELSFNPGGTLLRKQRFFMEFYFSFGARLYNNHISLDQKTADARYFGDWTVPFNNREQYGLNLAPKMTVNIRFGLEWTKDRD